MDTVFFFFVFRSFNFFRASNVIWRFLRLTKCARIILNALPDLYIKYLTLSLYVILFHLKNFHLHKIAFQFHKLSDWIIELWTKILGVSRKINFNTFGCIMENMVHILNIDNTDYVHSQFPRICTKYTDSHCS